MRLSYEQILSDEKAMTDFICKRLTETPTKLVLAAGEEGETWAELWGEWDDATGWNLSMEKSDESVDLEEVYDHFRRKEMTYREWWREFDRQMDRLNVIELEAQLWRQRSTRTTEPQATDEYGDLPREVATAEAARILSVSKDTVLKLKDAGLLEYRNMAPPFSSRPVFAFSLASVLKLRTTYETDEPPPLRQPEPTRRAVKGEKKYKHLKVQR